MIIFGSFLPSLLVGLHLQSLLGHGSRHCYGIITLTTRIRAANLAFENYPFADCFTPGNPDSIDQQLAECVRRNFPNSNVPIAPTSPSRETLGHIRPWVIIVGDFVCFC